MRDLRGSRIALYGHWVEPDVQAGKTSFQDREYVPHSRAGPGSDDADHARIGGQRLLPVLVEEAFGGELSLELFESQLQRPGRLGLHLGDDDLILPAFHVGGDPAAGQDLQAVLQLELDFGGVAFKKNPRDLRLRILQREIGMAGRVRSWVGEFALHPDIGEGAVEQVLNAAVEFGDREGSGAGGRIRGHFFPGAPLSAPSCECPRSSASRFWMRASSPWPSGL